MLRKSLGVEFGVRIDFPREKACAQWTEGNEADLELLACRQHAIALRVARPQGILTLDCRQRLHGVRAPDRLRTRLRKSEIPNLPGGDQLLHGSSDILNGHRGIHPVLIEDVDGFDLESAQ